MAGAQERGNAHHLGGGGFITAVLKIQGKDAVGPCVVLYQFAHPLWHLICFQDLGRHMLAATDDAAIRNGNEHIYVHGAKSLLQFAQEDFAQ
ncbi:hypothetical protein [Deinococcus multiflagellatus]|uniref:Uncharacterized protein n=1 Tax=Deinococcus multiflagellatus TaxID=1656887 RepID=A0ABW1ZJ83_9DEIO